MSNGLESGISSLSLGGNREGSAGRSSSGTADSGNGNSSGLPIRKRDKEHNFLVNAPRPGLCKAKIALINVYANYFRVRLPPKIVAYKYQLDYEVEVRNRGIEKVEKKDKCTELFWMFYEHQRRSIFPSDLNEIVFDGVHTLFSASKLNLPDLKPGQTSIQIQGEIEKRDAEYKLIPAKRGALQYRITIIPIPMVKVDIDPEKPLSKDDEMLIVQFTDLCLDQPHRCPLTDIHRRFVQHGNSIYKIPEKSDNLDVRKIGRGLQVWTGLSTGLKMDTPSPLLNCNTSSSVFYEKEMNMVKFVAEVMYGTPIEDVREHMNGLALHPKFYREICTALKSTRVRITLPNGRDKYKKFDTISELPANRYMFTMVENNQRMSVAEYYLMQYNLSLEAPNLPCVLFKSKPIRRGERPRETAYPMEFCHVFMDVKRLAGRLNDQQLATMIRAASRDPMDKKRDIERLVSADGEHMGMNAVLDKFNIQVERQMMKIKDVVVLPKPNLIMSSGLIAVHETGEHNLFDDKERAEVPVKIEKRCIVPFFVYLNGAGIEYHNNRERTNARANFFMNTLETYGLNIQRERGDQGTLEGYWRSENGRVYFPNVKGLNELVDTMIERCNTMEREEGLQTPPIPVAIFVFDRRVESLYTAIKFICDVQKGIVTQCMLQSQWLNMAGNRVKNTTATNLMLKILAKLGGLHYKIDGTAFKNWGRVTNREDPTIFLGIDVSHPGTEERAEALQKAVKPGPRPQHNLAPSARPQAKVLFEGMSFTDCPRSVLSVVGNIDTDCLNFQPSSRVQRLNQEIGRNLKDMYVERLQEFIKNAGVSPKHVVLLRDGISDTQFNEVRFEESKALEAAFSQLGMIAENAPTVTYIVAQKRHNCRLFPDEEGEKRIRFNQSDPGNLLPGVLVETEIVSKHNFDFFLLSHYGTKGTARPTKYTVLRDDWKPSSAFWQTVLYALCYGNLRCPKPLSIPAPLHYAHLAAKRAKAHFDHFKRDPTEAYIRSKEDLVREEMEKEVVNIHKDLREMHSMPFM